MKKDNIIEIAKKIINDETVKESRIRRTYGKILFLFIIIFILIMSALIYSLFVE